MKKLILSPLCSAFVTPGLGQIINRDLKKGLVIMAMVFLLLVWGTIEIVSIIKTFIIDPSAGLPQSEDIMARLKGEASGSLRYIAVAFGLLWVYSVLDAFWRGRKLDN